ncbi:MAG: response regulator transcription factor [Ardenticatenaceae bacterium]|nr:response regulator transcription factor [Ardenticatenaceae bacterium]
MSDKILIVEDEVRIVRTLRLYLEQAGFAVTAVHDGAQAVPAFRQERPSLVLLDLNLPGQDGLDICRSLRRLGDVPIIMLTARTEEMDRLIGLELGADDYISKPFSPREVVARVRAVLRRTQGGLTNANLLQAGALKLDLAAYRVWLDGQLVDLTQMEFELLATLMRHKGHVLSRAQLLQALQGVAHEELERAIDQHIKNVRRKLKETVGDVAIISTIYGVGYRLDEVELPHA